MKTVIYSLGLILLLFSISCTEEEVILAPDGLSYSPGTLSLTSIESVTSSIPIIEGTQPITFSLSGNTIPQITIDAEGKITVASGATPGTYKPTVIATNKKGSKSFSNIITITVNQALVLPTTFSYTPATSEVNQGTALSTNAPQSNSIGPVTYSLTVTPSAANNITINNQGVIQATNTLAAGTYLINVTVTNTAGSKTFSSAFTLVVKAIAAPQVSFVADIKPILNGTCTGCHSNFSDANSVQSNVDKILDRIQRQQNAVGFMPQGGQPLSPAQIELIKKWKTDGFGN